MYAASYQMPLTFMHVLTILFLAGCKNECRTEKKCFFSFSQLGHVINEHVLKIWVNFSLKVLIKTALMKKVY